MISMIRNRNDDANVNGGNDNHNGDISNHGNSYYYDHINILLLLILA